MSSSHVANIHIDVYQAFVQLTALACNLVLSVIHVSWFLFSDHIMFPCLGTDIFPGETPNRFPLWLRLVLRGAKYQSLCKRLKSEPQIDEIPVGKTDSPGAWGFVLHYMSWLWFWTWDQWDTLIRRVSCVYYETCHHWDNHILMRSMALHDSWIDARPTSLFS